MKKTNNKTSGRIIQVNDDVVVIRFSDNMSSYKNGQRVIVSIPYERKTALGKVVNVAEIVAHGNISAILDNDVVVQSKRANPIISKPALRESYGKERVMLVDPLD